MVLSDIAAITSLLVLAVRLGSRYFHRCTRARATTLDDQHFSASSLPPSASDAALGQTAAETAFREGQTLVLQMFSTVCWLRPGIPLNLRWFSRHASLICTVTLACFPSTRENSSPRLHRRSVEPMGGKGRRPAPGYQSRCIRSRQSRIDPF